MKNWKFIFGLMILAIMVSACMATQSSIDNAALNGKKLVIYYSLTSNTKFLAEQIQSLTGADIFELLVVDPYSTDIGAAIGRAGREREAGYLPSLVERINNLSDYDVIFIGSPNWFGTLSLPVLSFLESHDLSGKTIVPFITFGRGGLQNTVTELKEQLPNAAFLEEFGVAGIDVRNSQSDISQWLRRIGMLN